MNESTTLATPIRIDPELTEDVLEELITQNVLGRNKDLETLIGLLNTVEGGTFISLDGGWGSGKTVFVRQLDYLNTARNLEEIHALRNKETLERFREKYLTFYYNAWANDDQDPLQSLLFNLLKESEPSGRFKKGINIAKNLVKALGVGAINSLINKGPEILSAGLITTNVDIRNLSDDNALTTSVERLIEETNTLSERKKAVSELIKDILPEEKKLLFIVDELDRCAPSFAVRLLEAVKHYCLEDRIVFLLATNNSQLAHTVKKSTAKTPTEQGTWTDSTT